MINNQNFSMERAKRVGAGPCTIWQAREGASYAHHPYLCFYKGKYIAMFSLGIKNEDDLGQRAVVSVSEDFEHWSEPIALCVTQNKDSVDTACGFFVQDDVLYAFVGSYFYDETHVENGVRIFKDAGHCGTALYMLESLDGIHFSLPRRTNLNMVPNMSPKKLRDGRVMLCGNFSMPYTKNIADVRGWTVGGLDALASVDDSESFYAVSERLGLDSVVCECDIFERAGGITALFRSQKKDKFGWLYASESADGVNWTLPRKTNFSNDTSKFSAGNLIDGRIYWVGNPVVGGGRNPLVLSLSENGEDFTNHFILTEGARSLKYKGFAKGGTYAYPYAFEREGNLFVVYSVNKEDIECIRVDLH